MMLFFKSNNLNKLLSSYEASDRRWNVDVTTLSFEDCTSNLEKFISQRESQRARLETFFEEKFDLRLLDLFKKNALLNTLVIINEWSHQYLLPVYKKNFRFTEFFFSRPFSEKDKVLLLISDLGFYFGDVIKHHSPEYEWSLIAGLKQADDYEFHRPVLSINGDHLFDIERVTYQQYKNYVHEFRIHKEAFGKNKAFEAVGDLDKFTGHMLRFFRDL